MGQNLKACAYVSSTTVTPRRPLAKDPQLDYDVDSDDEWEEEPEGENLSVSLSEVPHTSMSSSDQGEPASS